MCVLSHTHTHTHKHTHTHTNTHAHTLCVYVCTSVAVCKAHMATGLDTKVYICTCKTWKGSVQFLQSAVPIFSKNTKEYFPYIYLEQILIIIIVMPLVDKWTAMWCHVVPAGVLHECQVWTSVCSLWLCFCFFQVAPHSLVIHPISNRLLQKDVFTFLDTTVDLESKLWMYL